jgi:LDH2 family malate/lactate/ureidoglycolate dehydrogenase
MPVDEFRERMSHLIKEHRGVPRAPGTERVYLPGEIEHDRRMERLASGIPLEPYVVKALAAVGQELALDTTLLGRWAARGA